MLAVDKDGACHRKHNFQSRSNLPDLCTKLMEGQTCTDYGSHMSAGPTTILCSDQASEIQISGRQDTPRVHCLRGSSLLVLASHPCCISANLDTSRPGGLETQQLNIDTDMHMLLGKAGQIDGQSSIENSVKFLGM
eukprot:SAG31_NODE_731_length_12498_cov_7.368336_8_plen_136_part_00